MKTIDLNCDLGEWVDNFGFQKDQQIMSYITSCNIACGGHIGDQESMQKTIRLAIEHGVAIGAHPSYPDKKNFGRKTMQISEKSLRESLVHQLTHFISLLNQLGAVLHHIKLHGALYNEASKNKKMANFIVSIFDANGFSVPIYCQYGSKLDEAVKRVHLKPIYEVFADRAYDDSSSLRSRELEGAIIHKKEDVFEHIHRIVMKGIVRTYSGKVQPITANTVCLHSDTHGSIELAKGIYTYLKEQGVTIATH